MQGEGTEPAEGGPDRRAERSATTQCTARFAISPMPRSFAIEPTRSGAPAATDAPGMRCRPGRGSGRGQVVERDELRDRPAHRRPHHMGALDSRMVEHGHRVVGHLRERVAAEGLVAAPHPAVVDGDRPEVAGEGEPLEGPAVQVRGQALDHQQGRGGGPAEHLVVETRAVGGMGERHGRTLGRRGSAG